VLAVEGCAGTRGDVDRAQRPAARRIEGVERVSSGKADALLNTSE
jgi:hypothetical protein